MKAGEKVKTQKIIQKVEQGSFDENDVDNILMKLRDYAQRRRDSVFVEIADFVAHSKTRNRGISVDVMKTMYLNVKFLSEYKFKGRLLDMSSPFPRWIFDFMKLQLDRPFAIDLEGEFGVKLSKLRTDLCQAFTINGDDAKLKSGRIPSHVYPAVTRLLSFIDGRAAYSQDALKTEFMRILRECNMQLNGDLFEEQFDRITLCVLLLIHNANVEYGGYRHGICKMYAKPQSIWGYVDPRGSVVYEGDFGCLGISAETAVNFGGQDRVFIHGLMESNLDPKDYCDPSLFLQEVYKSEDHQVKLNLKLDLSHELMINADFRLVPIGS
ncbi:MAG: hypothetical protein Q7P63_10185 [Verrucomicrobiota bacterium JB022]|nr:hypothetical protein [Verrucomicrobiota bacterium JB022]